MTQIGQDTTKVHLVGEDGRALCGMAYAETVVNARDWTQGFTPASLGARICRDCEAKAGSAARFAEGERGAPSGMKPIDRT